MPIYEYACPDCGHVVDRFYPMESKPQTILGECPSCLSGKGMTSIISAPAISYSGTGSSSKIPSIFKDRLRQIKKELNPDMKSSIV